MADPAVKLTPKQRHVLRALVRSADRSGVPLTVPEIGAFVGHRLREWARDPIYALFKLGAVEATGYAAGGAQCWQPTDKGRALLDALKDEGEGRDL